MRRGAQLPARNRIRNVLIGIGAAALLVLIVWCQRIDTVYVEGVDFYTEQEIEAYLFDSKLERNMLFARLKDRFGKNKEIPFVAGYTLEFTGGDTVTVTVYEKSIIGYVDYMGSHIYFDKDGTVVESSSRLLWDGIPLITGLDFDSIVLYRPLPVENENAFTQILNLTQLVGKHGILVDKIYFDAQINRMHPEAISFLYPPDDCADFVECKQKYGDVTTLIGCVAPTTVTVGTPEKVEAECKASIDAMAKGGGFMLATGCELISTDAFDNAHLMVDIAKTYGAYK